MPKDCAYLAVVVLVCGMNKFVFCQTMQDIKDLKAVLFNDSYDVTIRPIGDQSEPMHVTASLSLLAIHELDEVKQSLKTTGVMYISWIDESLTWEQESYGYIDRLYVPQYQIWKPDVALKNSLKEYKSLGDDSLYVEVFDYGSVTWTPIEVFLSTCSIDITYFPNDIQTCDLTFVAWSYTRLQVILEGDAAFVLTNYESNSAWDVIGTESHDRTNSVESEVIFEIKLKRKPTYSMLTLVFPVIMLSILNLFVFALPSDSGEKASYAVTVFLAFAVFLTIMESSFPQNSETVSYFAIFVIVGTVQSTVVTLVALIMIRCAAFGESTKVPACLIYLVRFIKFKTLRKVSKINKIGAVQACTLEDADIPQPEQVTNVCVREDQNSKTEYTWKYCIDSLDTVFFCFFVTTCCVSILFFFVMIN